MNSKIINSILWLFCLLLLMQSVNSICDTMCNNCTSFTCSSCNNGSYLLSNACPTCVTGCTYCTAATSTTCISCGIGYYKDTANTCSLCNTLVPNCTYCSNNVTCTTCVSPFYYVNGSNKCDLCNVTLIYCLECSSSAVCTKCPDLTHFISGLDLCQFCNKTQPYCTKCNGPAICTLCDPTHYVDVTFKCQFCYFGIVNCIECTSISTCTLCKPLFYLNAVTHLCPNCVVPCYTCTSATACLSCVSKIYYYKLNACFKCSSAIDNCNECSDQFTCTKCNTDFQPYLLSNGTYGCHCSFGTLITSTCSNITGCISSHYFNSVVTCFACDSSKNFVFVPAQNNCTCRIGYVWKYGFCTVLCGDGYYVNQGCDDGNLNQGDGCDSSCNQQANFDCDNVFAVKSVCRLNVVSAIKVYSLIKNFGSNSLSLALNFQPSHVFQLQNDWKYYISVNTSSLQYSSASQFDSGILTLNYNILSQVESNIVNWEICFDPQVFTAGCTNLAITMRGQNAPLTPSLYASQQLVLLITSYVFGCISLILSIISMFKSNPNISFQLGTTILFIFYSRMLSFNQNSSILYSLSGLRVAAGYNQLFWDSNRDYNQYIFKARFFIMSETGNMILLTQLLTIVVIVIQFSIRAKVLRYPIKDQSERIKMSLGKLAQKKYDQASKFNLKFTLPIIIISSYYIFAAVYGRLTTASSYEPYFSPYLENVFAFLLTTVVGYCVISGFWFTFRWSMSLEKQQKSQSKQSSQNNVLKMLFVQKRNYYQQAFFLNLLLQICLLIFTFDPITQTHIFNYGLEASIVLVIAYIGLIIYIKPYQDLLENCSIIYFQCIKLWFLLFLTLVHYGAASQIFQLIATYFTVFFIIVAIGLSILRIKKGWVIIIDDKKQFQKLMADKKKLIRDELVGKITQKKQNVQKSYQLRDPNNRFAVKNHFQNSEQQQQIRLKSYMNQQIGRKLPKNKNDIQNSKKIQQHQQQEQILQSDNIQDIKSRLKLSFNNYIAAKSYKKQ